MPGPRFAPWKAERRPRAGRPCIGFGCRLARRARAARSSQRTFRNLCRFEDSILNTCARRYPTLDRRCPMVSGAAGAVEQADALGRRVLDGPLDLAHQLVEVEEVRALREHLPEASQRCQSQVG